MAADFVRTTNHGDGIMRTGPVGYIIVVDVVWLRKQREIWFHFWKALRVWHSFGNGIYLPNSLRFVLIILKLNDMANLTKSLAIWFRRQ